MKNIFISLMLFALAFTSCQDWLDEKPKAVAAETFYNTTAEADASVLASLGQLRSGFAMSFPGLMECFSDYSYGRGSWVTNSDYQGLNTQNISRANGVWGSLYNSIRDCNIAISKIPEAAQMTEEQKSSYIAEQKFIRGFCYFHLVRLWNNIPLRTDKNMEEWDLGKTPADDIYKFIISDLEFAVSNCPETARLVGTPSRNAAKSLLAQVYLQLGQYQEAATMSKSVIDSGKYSLITVSRPRDFEKIFGPDVIATSEEIFYLKSARADSKGWEFVMFCSHPGAKIEGKKMHGAGGWYGIYTTTLNKIVSEWDVKDYRKDYNLLKYNFGMGDNTYLMAKFYDPDAPNSGGAGNSNPLIRYADVLLLYAEATTMATGTPTSEAMEMLNRVHRRAYGYDPKTTSIVDFNLQDYATKQLFLDLLVKERGYETMNEGKRWLELVRMGIAKKTIKEVKGIDIAEKHFLFPIPTTEFDYNKGLDPSTDQNPGY